MIELTGPAEDQEQHVNISHQDNASQTGTVVIHEEVIGNLTPPFHKLKDQEVSGSRLHSVKERLWEPDDGLVCMTPPVIGLSKSERKQTSSTPYSKNSTSTWLTKKTISVKEVDEKMKAGESELSDT